MDRYRTSNCLVWKKFVAKVFGVESRVLLHPLTYQECESILVHYLILVEYREHPHQWTFHRRKVVLLPSKQMKCKIKLPPFFLFVYFRFFLSIIQIAYTYVILFMKCKQKFFLKVTNRGQ